MKTKKNNNTRKTRKTSRSSRIAIKSPNLEPYIFYPMFKKYILEHSDKVLKLNFNELGRIFYDSPQAKYYNSLARSLIKSNTSPDSNLILYMNFKSHNILFKEKREKLYSIISEFQPNIICLSEALLPINIKNNKERNSKNIVITDIDSIKDDVIVMPYKGGKDYQKFKIAKMGVSKEKKIWADFFKKNGYKYIVFANPTECPWGENWGNCIISKTRPDKVDVLQMKPYGKSAFGSLESRNMISAKFGMEYICTTHLDNNNIKARVGQTNEIIRYIKKLKLKKNEHITLTGDFNSVNRLSYTKEELKILREININKEKLPFDAVDMLNKSNLFNGPPINTGQKYESLYQKCVSHVYSTKYRNNVMVLSDATDMDHQMILIW